MTIDIFFGGLIMGAFYCALFGLMIMGLYSLYRKLK
jgi:hypothetical protein